MTVRSKPVEAAPIIVLVGVALAMLLLVTASHLPAGRLMRASLRQVYAPRSVKIATLTTNGMESCGFYVVQGDPQQWRYLSTTEGLSKVWQSQSAAAKALEHRWDSCLRAGQLRGRGRGFDWFAYPAAVAYLNAT